MEFYFTPSFDRIVKKLDPHFKTAVKTAVGRVIDLYVSNEGAPGLGVKRLRGALWEARAGIKIRVLYELTEDRLNFVLAGSHDDVKNFLKR